MSLIFCYNVNKFGYIFFSVIYLNIQVDFQGVCKYCLKLSLPLSPSTIFNVMTIFQYLQNLNAFTISDRSFLSVLF